MAVEELAGNLTFVGNLTGNPIVGFYHMLIDPIPVEYRFLVNFAFYALFIAVYAIFVWEFYTMLAKRDLLELNLKKYNRTEHPFLNKLFASLLYLAEYIIILPVVTVFWFAVLSLFLLLLSKGQTVQQILLVSAGIVTAIRLTSYFKEGLSRDLAKIFPFTVLVIFLLEPNFFSIQEFTSRLLEIPSFLQHIVFYIGIIAGIEIIIRFFYLILDMIFTRKTETESAEAVTAVSNSK